MVYGGTQSEEKSKIFRRSIYVAQDIKAGDLFTEENLRIIRPGLGLPPKFYDKFLGRKAAKDAKKGIAVDWDLLGSE